MRGARRYAVYKYVMFEEICPQAMCKIRLFLSVDLYSFCTHMSLKLARSLIRCLFIYFRKAVAPTSDGIRH